MKVEDISQVWEKMAKLGELSGAGNAQDRFPLESILLPMKEFMHCQGIFLYMLDGSQLGCEACHIDIKGKDRNILLSSRNVQNLFVKESLSLKNSKRQQSLLAQTVMGGHPIHIAHLEQHRDYDLSFWKELDKKFSLQTTSLFSLPLFSDSRHLLGVLLFYNFRTEEGVLTAFPDEYQKIAPVMAHFTAMTLHGHNLNRDMALMFESLVKVLASAIDEKSSYTGGHCRRVPVLAKLLAEAADATQEGPLKQFKMGKDDYYILNLAALLHDCGKIVIPPHVMDKATKLETITDRIHEIEMRFEILLRDVDQKISSPAEREQKKDLLRRDFQMIKLANRGEERMDQALIEELKRIARSYSFTTDSGKKIPILTDDELLNLCVVHGTLTERERDVINHHVDVSIKMLEQIHFPKHLKRIPEIAGNHHEHMDGTGHPRGLKKHEMSILARLMGVVDVFEALTAKDRPYKKGKKLSETLMIMKEMVKDQKIDGDLFKVFVDNKVFLEYAQTYLDPEQIDIDDSESLSLRKAV